MKYREIFEYIADALGADIVGVSPVSGGYMHEMFRLETNGGAYAVKVLSAEVMSRADAVENYMRAEHLEGVLEAHGIPILRAREIGGQRMQCVGGRYFYVFDWVDGKVLRWGDVTASHAAIAGKLLGCIHNIERHECAPERGYVNINWDDFIARADVRCPDVADAVRENLPLLREAENEYNAVLSGLPDIVTICDGDMDCKNVMWRGDEPIIIDLECLDYGSPYGEVWILALSWAGDAVCEFDEERFRAFMDAYMSECDVEIDARALYGMGFSWLHWLEYCLRRAVGECGEDVIDMGKSESAAAIGRIKFYMGMKEKLTQ